MKRRYSWPLIGLASLIALLVALHLALPGLVRDYLNDKLADMGEYRGRVADVDLAWWRGAYQVKGLEIVKTSGKVPVPFMQAPVIDISVSWHALWYDHAVVAEVAFVKPELNFVDGGNKQASQTGQGTDWRQQLDKLLPITLNEVRIDDGTLTFRNFNSKPKVDLKATDLQASIRNLTNVKDEDKGFFRSIWEAVVGTTETVLKNQSKNQFATRVELSGSVHKSDVSAFEAFLQILRNGFVQAFSARYERESPDAD